MNHFLAGVGAHFGILALALCPAIVAGQGGAPLPIRGSVAGVVVEAGTDRPLAGAEVTSARDARIMAAARTDSAGRFAFHDLGVGRYSIEVRHLGYHPHVRTIDLAPDRASSSVRVRLEPAPASLGAVRITAAVPMAVDVRSGDQSYQVRNAHSAPTTTTSQILQEAIAGAARAPTGEVHIRGQHAEYTYYVDGVPVPAGISGSLNELFDATVVDRIDFQTGGWDAEYGNKNIAVVKVATRIPEGRLRTEVSAFTGSFPSYGASVLVSDNVGAVGMLFSASRLSTGMRREPVMYDQRTGRPLNFHNDGVDQNGFLKIEYRPSATDRVMLNASTSSTHFAVPFDSSGGTALDDHQRDLNVFVNVGWTHRFAVPPVVSTEPAPSRGAARELFAGLYFRRGGLTYEPGVFDRPSFVFYPDTTRRYSVREDRGATTVGLKVDYALPLTLALTVKAGVDGAYVTGGEDFDTRDFFGRAGPAAHSGVRGGDAGVYGQAVVTPNAHWELRTGARVDHHVAPLAGDQHQVSPRVRLAYLPDPSTSLWLYYGRLFIPSNVEDFHVLASAAQGGAVGLPTVPERDHYFEAGLARRFAGGVTLKLAAYRRDDSPAVDDNTLPGTALTTTVNVARTRVRGLESVVHFDPGGPFSGYVNAALSHASAHGPITGGFFPTQYPTGWFDQDHDQRLSVVAGGTYGFRWGYASLTGIFGSGLTNGSPEAAPNETGLFAFNPRVKVAPSFIVNASAGTSWVRGSTIVRPEVFVDNVFDRHYILKGAFTSGASVGRPRAAHVRVTVART